MAFILVEEQICIQFVHWIPWRCCKVRWFLQRRSTRQKIIILTMKKCSGLVISDEKHANKFSQSERRTIETFHRCFFNQLNPNYSGTEPKTNCIQNSTNGKKNWGWQYCAWLCVTILIYKFVYLRNVIYFMSITKKPSSFNYDKSQTYVTMYMHDI